MVIRLTPIAAQLSPAESLEGDGRASREISLSYELQDGPNLGTSSPLPCRIVYALDAYGQSSSQKGNSTGEP